MGNPSPSGPVGGSPLNNLLFPSGISSTSTDIATIFQIENDTLLPSDQKALLQTKISLNIAYGGSGNVPAFTSSSIPTLADPGRITILQLGVVQDYINELKKMLNQIEKDNPTLNKNMWIEGTLWSGLQGIFRAMLTSQSEQESDLYATQLSEILQFNNGTIDVNQYNANVAQNNETIAQLNSVRSILGLPTMIPNQATATTPPVSVNSFISTSIDDPAATNPAEQALYNSIRSELNGVNSGAATDYNQVVLSSKPYVDNMNTALNEYLNGTITQSAYNDAVNTYMAYVNTTNASIQSTLGPNYLNAANAYNFNLTKPGGYNEQIAAFNVDRQNQNLPLIPIQNGISVPVDSSSLLLPTIATAPPQPSPTLFLSPLGFILPAVPSGSSTPTTLDVYLSTYGNLKFPDNLADLDFYLQKLSLVENYRSSSTFYIKGKHNIIPNGAFIEKQPKIFLQNQRTSSTGSGVGLSLVIMGLDTSNLTALLSNSIIAASRSAEISPLTQQQQQRVVQALADFGLAAFGNISKLAIQPALSVLGPNLESLSPNSLTASAATSLALLNNARSLVLSKATSDAVNKALIAAGLSTAQIAALAPTLTETVNLNLLLAPLLYTASSLNLPGLFPQVVGNLNNVPNSSALIGATTTNTTSDLLRDSVKLSLLKSSLSDRLLEREPNISTSQAQNLVNSVVNRAVSTSSSSVAPSLSLASQAISQSTFGTSLQNSFQSSGLSTATTLALKEQASNFITREKTVSDLDTLLSQRNLNSQLLNNPLFSKPELSNAIAKVPINNVSRREFGQNLSSQLEKQGLSPTEASDLATQALLATQNDELKRSFDASQINQDRLTASLLSSETATKTAQKLSEEQTNLAAELKKFSLDKFRSEEVYRQGLAQKLALLGISTTSAASLAESATISLNNVEPLKQTGNINVLDLEALRSKLTSDLTNRLKGETDVKTASNLAASLTLAILGPSKPNVAYTEEVKSPHSTFHLMELAVDNLVRSTSEQHQEVVFSNIFTAYLKPLIDGLSAAGSLGTPATNFAAALSQIQGSPGGPSLAGAFRKSIDSPV